jgi:lipoprotein-releasing system ATP-binding protein
MIDIKGITKSFGSLQVLKGIDLHIDKGEVVSIVGPSGAGKTTLLQIMGTLDKPDSGAISVDGVDVMRLSSNKLSDFRNQHIGFVFQFHQLLPEFTALENIMIPAYIGGTGAAAATPAPPTTAWS